MPTTRESLEAALAADPDNRTLHSAYADLLIEEGDPRGEYIRRELTDPDTVFSERMERTRLERDWLGPLKHFLPNYPPKWRPHRDREYMKVDDSAPVNGVAIHWVLGWIDVAVIARNYTTIARAIGEHPLGRLLREVCLVNFDDREPLTGDQFTNIVVSFEDRPVREWRMFGFVSLGDEIVERLVVRSGLGRLESLGLSRCGITDYGACLLASSQWIRTIRSLQIDDNHLSPIGIAALAEVGFAVGPQRDNPGWGTDAD
ncbi:MAG: TIGR02996 domain-containing protein [Gemmataceae bacterium]|nr:TIGR02996 domain-containing protein [Gemmataceae bacterium]